MDNRYVWHWDAKTNIVMNSLVAPTDSEQVHAKDFVQLIEQAFLPPSPVKNNGTESN